MVKDPPKIDVGSDTILKWMVEKGVPLTREEYLAYAYMGDPPPEELPEEIQDALTKLPE